MVRTMLVVLAYFLIGPGNFAPVRVQFCMGTPAILHGLLGAYPPWSPPLLVALEGWLRFT